MIRVGTCSWKYPSWLGLVYDLFEPPNYLEAYAAVYDTVEIDQWFWSLFPGREPVLPSVTTVAEYAASVPDTFRFTIKLPNALSLTHVRERSGRGVGAPNPWHLSGSLLQEFLARIEPLQKQTWALILQFEYLNRQKVADALTFRDRLESFLDAIPGGWPIAVEIRNPTWMDRTWFEMLSRAGAIHVLNDGYWMPPVGDVYRRWRDLLVPRSVIRLLGPDRSGIEEVTRGSWDRRVAPQDDALRDVASIVREMDDRAFDVVVNVNNHYEGSAPRTITELRRLLAEESERDGVP